MRFSRTLPGFWCERGQYDDKVDPLYFDKENGWAKGGAVIVPDIQPSLFGAAVLVDGTFGPSKNIRSINPEKNYVFSAWVYPRNTNPMRFTVEPHNDGSSLPSGGNNYDDFVTGLQPSKWQFVKRVITSERLKSWGISNNGTDFIRIWIGNYCEGSVVDPNKAYFFVQDIRFAPSDAYVKTTYYDPELGLPRVTVDENNHPGKWITYDGFGRPVKWEQYDVSKAPSETGYLTTVMDKEYHSFNDLQNGENVRILAPSEAEILYANNTIDIHWVNRDNRRVNIECYRPDGTTKICDIIAGDYAAGYNSCQWTVPDVAVGDCKIKISLPDGSSSQSGIITVRNESGITLTNVVAEGMGSKLLLRWTGTDTYDDNTINYNVTIQEFTHMFFGGVGGGTGAWLWVPTGLPVNRQILATQDQQNLQIEQDNFTLTCDNKHKYTLRITASNGKGMVTYEKDIYSCYAEGYNLRYGQVGEELSFDAGSDWTDGYNYYTFQNWEVPPGVTILSDVGRNVRIIMPAMCISLTQNFSKTEITPPDNGGGTEGDSDM